MRSAIWLLILTGLSAGSFRYETDTLGQCKYSLIVPDKWNGKLLMYAHGLTAKEAPLQSEMDTGSVFEKALLAEGWMFAKSSYRRNGFIIKDAIADIADLKAHIDKKYGKPKQAFLVGASMGAVISTLIAEDSLGSYNGFLILCSVCCNTEYDSIPVTNAPRKPIVLLTNRDEFSRSLKYVLNQEKGMRPYLWIVNREGHCNLLEEEILEAFRHLQQYAKTGKGNDRLQYGIVKPWPKFAYLIVDSSILCTVKKIAVPSGTLTIAISPNALDSLRISKKDTLVFTKDTLRIDAVFGNKYSDVKDKENVAFFDYYDGLRLAVNFGSMVSRFLVSLNDTIRIRKK